jgi:hypothetical protein
MHPGNRVLWGCSAPLATLPRSSQLCQNGIILVLPSIGKREKSRMGGGLQLCCFWLKIPLWKRKFETVHCRDATASSFVAEVRGEVFAHFHAAAVKHKSSMRNWLFGLTGRIICEKFPWYQRKW